MAELEIIARDCDIERLNERAVWIGVRPGTYVKSYYLTTKDVSEPDDDTGAITNPESIRHSALYPTELIIDETRKNPFGMELNYRQEDDRYSEYTLTVETSRYDDKNLPESQMIRTHGRKASKYCVGVRAVELKTGYDYEGKEIRLKNTHDVTYVVLAAEAECMSNPRVVAMKPDNSWFNVNWTQNIYKYTTCL